MTYPFPRVVPIVLAILASVPSIFAQQIRRDVSLAHAMQLAMDHSPILAQARADIRTQLGIEIVAKSAFLPTIDANAGYNARDAQLIESFGPTVVPLDQSWIAATTDYGRPFVSVVARDNVMATQFHPEKSQSCGMQLLKNFLDRVQVPA